MGCEKPNSAINLVSSSVFKSVPFAGFKPPRSGEASYSGRTTDAILALHRGTLYRPVGTINAAVPRLWTQQGLAASTFVKKLTGVARHRFALGEAANRAHQHGV
jgi:hypothetical protein